MKRKTSVDIRPVQLFSEEKLAEFRHMPLRARLQWLEDANALIRKSERFTGKGTRSRGKA